MADQAIRDPETGLFIPDNYAPVIRQALPDYDAFQQRIGVAAETVPEVHRILDLGTGTGETASRVLEVHPQARIVGIDESPAMLAAARERLGERVEELIHGSFADELPAGPFDLVVSALAIHHLDHHGKQDLYRRIHAVLRPGGRFIQGDLRSDMRDPDFQPADNDIPAPAAGMVDWMRQAGFVAHLELDLPVLCVIVADHH